jgi:hypothetical protein
MRQVGDVVAADMAALDPCELWLAPLAGVQLGGIGWQALQVQALCRSPRQELLDDTAAVERRPVPDAHHAAGPLAQQVLETADDVGRVEGVSLAVAGELTPGRDGTARRRMVAGAPLAAARRVPDRGLGAHDAGQGSQA